MPEYNTDEWIDHLQKFIVSCEDEYEVGDKPLQWQSVFTFLTTMSILQPKKKPGFGLSHEGHLIASWQNGADRLTMEFLPDGKIQWVTSFETSSAEIANFAQDFSRLLFQEK